MRLLVDEFPESCETCFFGKYSRSEYIDCHNEISVYECKLINKLNDDIIDQPRLSRCPLCIGEVK